MLHPISIVPCGWQVVFFTSITDAGMFMDSRNNLFSGSHKVFPVLVCFIPIRQRCRQGLLPVHLPLLGCDFHDPAYTFGPVLRGVEDLHAALQGARINPDKCLLANKGSWISLKAKAENGAFGEGQRVCAFFSGSSMSMPTTAPTSIGEAGNQ